jgi:hypothetical protein
MFSRISAPTSRICADAANLEEWKNLGAHHEKQRGKAKSQFYSILKLYSYYSFI